MHMYATKFTKWLITDLIAQKSGKFPNYGKNFLPSFEPFKASPKNEIFIFFWQKNFSSF